MREQLESHIDILNTEINSGNKCIHNYKLYLENHKHLNLFDVDLDIKNKGQYRLPVLTPDMSFSISIFNYSDYGAIFNNMDIEEFICSEAQAMAIEAEYDYPVEDVLKSIAIKVIYSEYDKYLIKNLNTILANDDENNSGYSALHSLNAPSIIYKGELVFSKSMKQTKKSVAKDWLLIKALEFITHEKTYTDCWIGVKSVTLRQQAKKVFFEASQDPTVVIDWIASSLALRDPSYDQMLFELHKGVLDFGEPLLIDSVTSLMTVNNPIDDNYGGRVAENVIELNKLTDLIKNSVNADPSEQLPFDSIEADRKNHFNDPEAINPYTMNFPEKLLDPSKKRGTLLFQLSDFNHSIAENNEDKFRFNGRLIAYFDTKDMQESEGGTPRKWVEYFLFEDEDSYYLTKIRRYNNKRASGVVKSYKINNLEHILTRKISGMVAYQELMNQII